MRATFLGLGGGGARVVYQIYDWLEHLGAAKTNAREITKDPRLGWVFGTQALLDQGGLHLDDGIGFGILDAASKDLRIGDAKLGRDHCYRVAPQTDGFGGQWQKALSDIREAEAKKRSSPSAAPEKAKGRPTDAPTATVQQAKPIEVLPLTDYLSNALGIYSSGVCYPTFSACGGAGRGVFEYLIENRKDILAPGAVVLPVVVTPSLPESRGGVGAFVRTTADEYVGELYKRLKNGDFPAAIFVNFTLAQCLCAWDMGVGSSEPGQRHDGMKMMGEGLDSGDTLSFNQGIGKLADIEWAGLDAEAFLDQYIVVSLIPLMANAVAGSLPEEKQVLIRQKKVLDPNDILRMFRGQFVVPCYTPVYSRRSELERQFQHYYESFKDFFGERVARNPFTVLADFVTTDHSFVPLPRSLGKLKAKTAAVVVWALEGIQIPELDPFAQYLGVALGASPEIFILEGPDPIRGYIKGSPKADAYYRIWIYLGFTDPEIIQQGVRLCGAY